ncbi:D-alanyl-D-alanine carboxypeptidase family protein [Clostridium sp. MB40-C1]|uniref:D-alanyl-D-alanine carboxypeptidase family protein n=1 Tax=Clostridium sp. MB40-C1 TaxID=3070996 RepID=UPI0027DFC0CB|nr:D-alanyl-D-alanine carboxypeptidase family protein [Clostridium sp. MB40-C1]WMJ82330.1 D-alanyl-D-alanine carboxypeptidase family protein [Clostridium sp. MB40-C1]
MRKTIIFILTFILSISLMMGSAKANNNCPPSVSADGVILMDATTGSILYSKNKDVKYPPASTTKIMTALLVLENCKLDEVVTIGKEPPLADGSKIYIFEAEKLTVKDLLYGLLLQSANDCAEALAEHISGSKEDFAELMNKRAKELGCKNTTFKNPHGLYDDNHRTTAYDLGLILKELVKHPEYKKISTTSIYYIPPTNQTGAKRPIWNKNKLVQKNSDSYYPECVGGKTGYTIQSKHSYVAAASRNSQTLIAILLHDTKHTYWSDVINLFNYGFNNFLLETFHSKGDSLGTYSINKSTEIPIVSAENSFYVKDKTSDESPEFKINNKSLIKGDFKKGDIILDASIIYKNENVGTLKIASNVDYSSSKNLIASFSNTEITNSKLLKIASCIIIGALVVVFVSVGLKKRSKKKRKKFKHIH